MPETLISIDVETAGPNPSNFSMLSIGACLMEDPSTGFYVELKPINDAMTAEAFTISGLSLDHLQENGQEPAVAMAEFEAWIHSVVPSGTSPVFVGFNASFDWMFVCDYFQRLLGRNPFGHAALDIKSFYMGMTGGTWAQTSMRFLSPRYLEGHTLSHNALDDARDQAALFSAIRADAASSPHGNTKWSTA